MRAFSSASVCTLMLPALHGYGVQRKWAQIKSLFLFTIWRQSAREISDSRTLMINLQLLASERLPGIVARFFDARPVELQTKAGTQTGIQPISDPSLSLPFRRYKFEERGGLAYSFANCSRWFDHAAGRPDLMIVPDDRPSGCSPFLAETPYRANVCAPSRN